VAVASAEPYASLHLAPDRQPCQHSTTQFFTGRMPFLPPNQQHQSTEHRTHILKITASHGVTMTDPAGKAWVLKNHYAQRLIPYAASVQKLNSTDIQC